jgi:hypothetical protein
MSPEAKDLKIIRSEFPEDHELDAYEVMRESATAEEYHS